MKLFLLCLPLSFCLPVFAQTAQPGKTAVDSIEARYQQCLGQGKSNYNCALQYYVEMDRLLDSVYRTLYSQLDESRRESLQVSQQQWVEKKDAYFKNIEERAEKKRPQTLAGLDDDMIITDNKAAYLKTRVIALLTGMNS